MNQNACVYKRHILLQFKIKVWAMQKRKTVATNQVTNLIQLDLSICRLCSTNWIAAAFY